MEILLNGKKLDFEVEKETRLGEIIQSIARWLGQRGAVIVSCRLNDQLLDLAAKDSYRTLPLDAIQKLEIESQNAKVLVVETIGELSQYLDRIARLAPRMKDEEITDDSIKQLVDGLGWIVDVLKKVAELMQVSYRDLEFEGESFHKYLLKLGDVRDHVAEAAKSGNRSALKALLRDSIPPLCDTIVRALPLIGEKVGIGPNASELNDELDELAVLIEGLPEQLEAIAVKISIGDTAKGMEEFAGSVGALERVFKLIDRCRRELPLPAEIFVIQDKNFDERSAAISQVLDELIKAFEHKDRVLISDLIEYEIAPETEALASIIDKIRKNLQGACH